MPKILEVKYQNGLGKIDYAYFYEGDFIFYSDYRDCKEKKNPVDSITNNKIKLAIEKYYDEAGKNSNRN